MNWTEEQLKALQAKAEDRRKGAEAPKPTGKKKMQALGRLKQGEKNGTEQAYEDHLEWRKHMKEILWYRFEAVKLRLADNTFYTCDYFVMLANGELEAHEVKGFWTDDARVKIKVAADQYPFRFIAVQKVKKADGGGWRFEHFS
ncbi:hypothetical protein PQA73_gp47 [Erwinia phage Pavtok]|uniref:DUF1064 domain-containing protein n=1 Tax=Erwinia phage Pavtok TaxID=2267655 RepID=A0A345BM04_9CAUD|nr:hypothetical protein PQA73_gp47 [Erwinia phage Pavtok]AXF51475.1 hypothetical protein PAVTOK_47 [Erwinia phage Pavtok]